MALSKADFNNINVTPAASKKIKWNASANGFETGDVSGSMVLLSTATASSSATLDFTSGIDSTYKEYIFKFINIHPATDTANFTVGFRDGGTDYDATKTTTYFRAYHSEADTTAFGYKTDQDLAQSTSYQTLCYSLDGDADGNTAGSLHLFNPSSTTFVKHFIARTSCVHSAPEAHDSYIAGYCNVTAAIDGVQFKMSTGNIDAGVIKMYGVV
jgi:hypothetical protein